MRASLVIVFVLIGATMADTVVPSCFMSQAQRQAIVDTHNKLRNKVASGLETMGLVPGSLPKAQNMMAVSWNHDMELVASNWAGGCRTGDHPHRYAPRLPTGEDLGENIMWFGPVDPNFALSTVNVSQAVEGWYLEGETFPNCGHFQQFVWANVTEIGCGMALCYGEFSDEMTYYVEIVCNYLQGVTGDPNVFIYDKGARNCAKYGVVNSNQYTSLCGTSTVPNVPTLTTCPSLPVAPQTTSYGTSGNGWFNNDVEAFLSQTGSWQTCYQTLIDWIQGDGISTVTATNGVFTQVNPPPAGQDQTWMFSFVVQKDEDEQHYEADYVPGFTYLSTCSGNDESWSSIGASVFSPPLTNFQSFYRILTNNY